MKYTLVAITLFALLAGPLALAQGDINLPIDDPENTSAGLVQGDVQSTLTRVFTIIFRVLIFGAGALAVIMFIWAGLIYITNPSKGDDAKAKLIWGTVGLVVALISYALVQLIAQFSRSGTLQ